MENNLSHIFERTFSSLEEFADFISETLEGPVTIEDRNHRLLAYSTHEKYTDEARVSTIIGRRVPEKVINKLWRKGIIPTLHEKAEPVQVPEITEIGLGSRMAVSITKNNDVLGYIWIIEGNRAFTEHDAFLLKEAANKAVTQLQQVQSKTKEQERSRQECFWRLLTGDLQNEHAIQEQLSTWFPSMPTSAAVIVLEANEEINDTMDKNITYLITTSQKVKVLFKTREQHTIILLAEPVQPQSKEGIRWFLRDFMLLLEERFGMSTIEVGCGRLNSSFSAVKDSYMEAMEVIHVNRRLPLHRKSFLFYDELGFYRYADSLIKQKRQENLTDPAITTLEQYDITHNRELLKSLTVFLQNDGNMRKAANVLHIHVNTMAYRMNRVEEIINVDLNNAYQKLSLLLEISLEELKDR
ncbi:PucR family transcriptional regulator [Salibacterium salarium]|uniref:PucR family transcriptional regulator n=1 Tax=Salibacterium salarium TaxID=284579 RepID=A0A3R9QSP9_9BACI|nr:helix-turn-helix domain-containing protein [Salibacterium salarium]RSL32535.1 PucR family transcriptional regulator [Salibacterium salarium]